MNQVSFAILALFLYLSVVSHAELLPEPIIFTLSEARLQTLDEFTLFNYTCVSGSCILNYMWFTAYYTKLGETRFRYYVDGETVPSIDMEYYPGHALPYGNETSNAWESALFGRGAETGGVFNSFPIPFSKSVIITVQKPSNTERDPAYWFTVKGYEQIKSFSIGTLTPIQLPNNARLKLHKNVRASVAPLEYLTLFETQKSGLALAVMIAAESFKVNYLEGCIRAYTEDGETILASGTEDYFQSAFYFNGGQYYFPTAGLTYFNRTTHPSRFSAYKIHTEDILSFRNGMKLTWRNGDTRDIKTGLKCVNPSGEPVGTPRPALVTTYTYYYEW